MIVQGQVVAGSEDIAEEESHQQGGLPEGGNHLHKGYQGVDQLEEDRFLLVVEAVMDKSSLLVEVGHQDMLQQEDHQQVQGNHWVSDDGVA